MHWKEIYESFKSVRRPGQPIIRIIQTLKLALTRIRLASVLLEDAKETSVDGVSSNRFAAMSENAEVGAWQDVFAY